MTNNCKNLDINFNFQKEAAANQASGKNNHNQIMSNKNLQPEMRLAARFIDSILFSTFFVTVLSVYPSINVVVMVLLAFGGIFVESVFLFLFGATPGKWLLGVKIRSQDGGKPKYLNALSRSFKVWFHGLGMGIPIVTIFTMILAYTTLTTKGQTTWDKENKLTITHEKVGIFRASVASIICVVFIGLVYYSYMVI